MKFLISLVFIPFVSLSQVFVHSDTDSILIGDQFQLVISATESSALPSYNDSIGAFEILSKSHIDSTVQKDSTLFSQKYTLTAWESGTFYIPSMNMGDGTNDSTPIVVSAVALPDSVSLNQIVIKDIKGPINSPISFDELKPYLVILIILIILAIVIRRVLKKRKEKPIAQQLVEQIVPAHELAIDKLEKLKLQSLWQKGEFKRYYSELSEIIRNYIEDGLGTPAMEIPTKDIIEQLYRKGIDTNALKILLTRADLAKFAKAKPIDIENKESYEIALDFVRKTKPTEQTNDLE